MPVTGPPLAVEDREYDQMVTGYEIVDLDTEAP